MQAAKWRGYLRVLCPVESGTDREEIRVVFTAPRALSASSVYTGSSPTWPANPRQLFPLPSLDSGFSPYDTAPDGQRFVVRATEGQAAKPLTVIANWPARDENGVALPTLSARPWLEGLYMDTPEEWDDPYRFFR
jgi:hypothetical protein